MFKISIIVPIYNVQDYIERCINSILYQECDNFELECILVNDCTPDDSMTIIKRKLEYYCGNINFIVINHQKNSGLSTARNTGIKAATGDYIYFIDSDDRLEIDALKTLVDSLKNEVDVDIVVGNTMICKIGKSAMNFNTEKPLLFNNKNEMALQKILNREIYHIACNKLVKRELLFKYSIFFEEGIIDEDLLWSYFVFYNARQVLVVPQITYIYEDNPTSIMNTTSSRVARVVKSRSIICTQILDASPKIVFADYYMYIFYILSRAINLYELNQKDSEIRKFGENLFIIRDRLLHDVRRKRLFVLYLFFLTSKKPFYYLTRFRWFRRYYDKISFCVLSITKHII